MLEEVIFRIKLFILIQCVTGELRTVTHKCSYVLLQNAFLVVFSLQKEKTAKLYGRTTLPSESLSRVI